jgi:hypothetical protein
VLEEPIDDAPDADRLAQSRHPGPQRTDAAGDDVDRHTGLAGPVEGLDDVRIDERIELREDP